jgi:hypothetical protein
VSVAVPREPTVAQDAGEDAEDQHELVVLPAVKVITGPAQYHRSCAAGRSRGGEDSTSGFQAGTSEVEVTMMTGAASAAAEAIGV